MLTGQIKSLLCFLIGSSSQANKLLIKQYRKYIVYWLYHTNIALAYLNGLAGWHDASTNCFTVTDFGALWHIEVHGFSVCQCQEMVPANVNGIQWLCCTDSQLFQSTWTALHWSSDNINLIFDIPTTNVHSYFYFNPKKPEFQVIW